MSGFERFLEWYGLTAERLMKSHGWWRQALGFWMTLVVLGMLCVYIAARECFRKPAP